MNRTDSYQIETARTIRDLQTRVNKMIATNSGWEPVGGISTVYAFDKEKKKGACYVQAMVNRKITS